MALGLTKLLIRIAASIGNAGFVLLRGGEKCRKDGCIQKPLAAIEWILYK
ncbi:hypothetical protein [Neobacillus niacini]|nr:hypothetical protein [Neobacillus niacini]MCM3693240.1 hypothetical protein [Neobacillus niacini]